jgi:integrase
VKEVKHRAALDYAEMPAFMERTKTWDAVAARALTLLILTATRTGEILLAEWTEFDLETGLWLIPAERMKMKKAHAVPLSDAALTLLKPLYDQRTSQFVFPGQKPNRPLSNMAILMLFRRHGVENVTAHGMRSTFRNWAHDLTSFHPKIAEQALAHRNPDRVEAAYLRSTAFQKRAQLMQAWATYCEGGQSGDILQFHDRRS